MRTVLFLLFAFILFPCFCQKYQNFKVSIYCTVYNVDKMSDTAGFLQEEWNLMTKQLKVDKVYLETHRDMVRIDEDKLNCVKEFFMKRNIEVAGGITFTIKESNNFQTFCYSDPEHQIMVKEIAEFTAKNFDEIILDDFFFTSCKSDIEIKAKKNRTWTDYRLWLMSEAAQSLVIEPAKEVNPKVKIIIKYPNWYEHFQGLGFNLEEQPYMFDGIYTGTETRDAVLSNQHLQPYLGYNIFRYFENIAPGKNGGGWVDPYGIKNYDRYAEQLWITAFAKAPEITLFNFGNLAQPFDSSLISSWDEQNTSFSYKEMQKRNSEAKNLAGIAGYSLEKVDEITGFTGNPIGIKSYKPFHSTGEDFLQNYIGMMGIPIDQVPYFPSEENLIILTETAKYDKDLIFKIKKQLTEGKSVVITSGLLKELQDKGLNDIVELRYTDRKSIVNDYLTGRYQIVHGEKPVLIPQIQYLTNDSWEIVSGISGENGWPILHMADYSRGKLFVLTIPDNFADLYNLPVEALNKIRQVLCSGLEVYMESASNVAIYIYDNQTFIVESFHDGPVSINILTKKEYPVITDLKTNQKISGKMNVPIRSWGGYSGEPRNSFEINLNPHSFSIFRFSK